MYNGYYDYGYSDVGAGASSGLGAMLGVLAFVYIIIMAIGIFSLVCNWKVYKKAGKKGWEAIVPIYNIIVLLEITGLPMWYIVLFFIPIGNIIVQFLIYIELAKKFGQSTGFGIGLVFLNPIFMAMLAFGKKYTYVGAVNSQPAYNNQMNQPVNNQPVYNNQMNQPVNSQPVYNNQMNAQPMYNNQMSGQVNVQPQNIEQPAVKTCPYCGSQEPSQSVFCTKCGNRL